MRDEHVDDFVSGKCVLLNTLDNFRSVEGYDGGIQDPDEGSISYTHDGPTVSFGPNGESENKTLSRAMGGGFRNMTIDVSAISQNGPVTILRSVGTNCHIFSASNNFNWSIAGDLTEGYDSCVVIKDVEKFFYEIANALNEFYKPSNEYPFKASARDVKYMGTKIGGDGKFSPADPFRKERKFSIQREYRFVYLFHNSIKVGQRFLSLDTSKIQMSIRRRKKN